VLFTVVREIEGQHRDCWITRTENAARIYFETAKYVCNNEPLEPPKGDGAVVTNCWMYACETDDPAVAERLVLSGWAPMLEAYVS
jgi:hypothetical protein